MACAKCGRTRAVGQLEHPNAVALNWAGTHAGVVWYTANNRRYAFGDQDGYRTQKVFPEDVTPLQAKYPGIFN